MNMPRPSSTHGAVLWPRSVERMVELGPSVRMLSYTVDHSTFLV